jgi:hypothetical protein
MFCRHNPDSLVPPGEQGSHAFGQESSALGKDRGRPGHRQQVLHDHLELFTIESELSCDQIIYGVHPDLIPDRSRRPEHARVFAWIGPFQVGFIAVIAVVSLKPILLREDMGYRAFA